MLVIEAVAAVLLANRVQQALLFPEMQGRDRLAELKEMERRYRVAYGPPLTYREQALLYCLSTLYPPKKAYCNPEFSAEQSAFSAEEFNEDDSLEYQRTSADAPPDSSPPAESIPSEPIDSEEEWMSMSSRRGTISRRDKGDRTLKRRRANEPALT